MMAIFLFLVERVAESKGGTEAEGEAEGRVEEGMLLSVVEGMLLLEEEGIAEG
jgi:hypothetical protein